MSQTDPIDQVGRGAGGESLAAMERHADEMATFFAEMAAVTDDEVALSQGAGMDDGALFERCKQARVVGLMVGGERMSEADMRRALVVAARRDAAVAEVAARAAVAPEAQQPARLEPHVEAPPKPPEPSGSLDSLEPSRNGKYRVVVPGGGRRYVNIGGHLNQVRDGGEVALGSFSERDVANILRAGVTLVPDQPVFTSVTVKARLDVGLDVAAFEREVARAAVEIAADMARAAARKAKRGTRG